MRKFNLVILLIVSLLFVKGSFAQYYFGKNKVQYTKFDWQVFSTEHFDIYFYPEEREIAEIAAQLAEDSYKLLESKFNHHIDKKIPLIIYSSPNYFVQTNILPYLIGEDVGGFFEFIKGRTVIPFTGSYSDFERVIRHELVHVFAYAKISFVMATHHRHGYSVPPLWFIEGLAEHWSREWDSEADMIMRDLVLSDKGIEVNKVYESASGYLMYKVGQSLCKFLSESYGDFKLSLLFDDYWKADDFDAAIKMIYGKKLEDIGKDWEYWLRKKYFPYLKDKEPVERFAQQLTFSGFNLMPSVFPDPSKNEDLIAFKSDRLGYSMICLISEEGEKDKFLTLIKGERSSKFESLHLMESKIAVWGSKKLAFVSKSNERDVIYVYDISAKKIVLEKGFDDLIALSSPTWSRDGREIIFVGARKNGYSDLYRLSLSNDFLLSLTGDIYQEKDPAWSQDGKYVVFSSDRGEFGKDGYLNLFLLDLDKDSVSQLTCGRHNDISPAWSKDDKLIIFSSDVNGAFDLFTLNPSSLETRQLTATTSDLFNAQLSSKEDKIFLSAFKDYNFQLYKMQFPQGVEVVSPSDSSHQPLAWKPEKIAAEYGQASVRYKKRFSFDIAQSAIAYDAVYGTAGGGQVAMTDMLGNHQWIFLLGHSARTQGDFWSGFNLAATYVNRACRLNYGYGAYHFNDEYYDDYYGYFYERQYGVLGFVSYPMSKFERIETSMFLRRSDKDLYMLERRRKLWLSTNYVSLIKDTSIWGSVGPIDGTRLNLTLGLTTQLGKLGTYNRLVLADLRKYIRLSRRSCLAFRLMGFSSAGIEPQRIYLGGSWSLRGYERHAFYGRKALLVNNELRFPLIDDLLVKFPWGEIGFKGIGGSCFFDLGNAWERKFDHFYGAIGGGLRMSLSGVVVLRLDIVRRTDFTTISPDTDFDFFFGWDF